MGDGATTSIVRFVRQGLPGEPSSRDYDFSDISIRLNQEQGYAAVKETLAKGGTATDTAAATASRPSLPPGSLPSPSESSRLAPRGPANDLEGDSAPLRAR
jgi:hypothetical protein